MFSLTAKTNGKKKITSFAISIVLEVAEWYVNMVYASKALGKKRKRISFPLKQNRFFSKIVAHISSLYKGKSS